MAAKLSIAALERALKEKRVALAKLTSRREKLEKDLADVNKEIAKLEGGSGGGGASGRARRPKGEGLDVLVPKALAESDMPLRMREIGDACKALGYETASANFANVVAQYVYKDKNVVRVGRGLYTLKDRAAEMKKKVAAKKK